MEDFPSSPATIPNEQTRQWAMFLHFSQLAGFVAPGAGFVAPIIIWQVKKTEMPELDVHGKMVLNWMLSALIYGIVGGILCLVLIGVPLLIILGLLCVIFPIIGGIKANNGERWKYPLVIEFVK